MSRGIRSVSRFILSALLCITLAQAYLGVPGIAAQSGSLKVTVEYKGAGTVDKEHKLWIWLFDTPTIDESSEPVTTNSLVENGGTASFDALPETVYIAVCFDEKGGYDGTSGPPQSGSPVSIHGEAGAAKPVKTGSDTKVTVTFDDSMRMP